MKKIISGDYIFEIVEEIPNGYTIWNIGENMTEGCLPLCKLKKEQPFKGAREIEIDTLKALETPKAQEILSNIGATNSCNIKKLASYIERNKEKANKQRQVEKAKRLIPLIEELPGHKGLK